MADIDAASASRKARAAFLLETMSRLSSLDSTRRRDGRCPAFADVVMAATIQGWPVRAGRRAGPEISP